MSFVLRILEPNYQNDYDLLNCVFHCFDFGRLRLNLLLQLLYLLVSHHQVILTTKDGVPSLFGTGKAILR